MVSGRFYLNNLNPILLNVSVPSGPPDNLNILVTARSLNLTWSPPLSSQQNGIIISYIVTCSSQQHTVNRTKLDGHSNFVQIADLVPGSNYSCSVYASTIVGSGPPAMKSAVTEEESGLFFLFFLWVVLFFNLIINYNSLCIELQNLDHLLTSFMQILQVQKHLNFNGNYQRHQME